MVSINKEQYQPEGGLEVVKFCSSGCALSAEIQIDFISVPSDLCPCVLVAGLPAGAILPAEVIKSQNNTSWLRGHHHLQFGNVLLLRKAFCFLGEHTAYHDKNACYFLSPVVAQRDPFGLREDVAGWWP